MKDTELHWLGDSLPGLVDTPWRLELWLGSLLNKLPREGYVVAKEVQVRLARSLRDPLIGFSLLVLNALAAHEESSDEE